MSTNPTLKDKFDISNPAFYISHVLQNEARTKRPAKIPIKSPICYTMSQIDPVMRRLHEPPMTQGPSYKMLSHSYPSFSNYPANFRLNFYGNRRSTNLPSYRPANHATNSRKHIPKYTAGALATKIRIAARTLTYSLQDQRYARRGCRSG